MVSSTTKNNNNQPTDIPQSDQQQSDNMDNNQLQQQQLIQQQIIEKKRDLINEETLLDTIKSKRDSNTPKFCRIILTGQTTCTTTSSSSELADKYQEFFESFLKDEVSGMFILIGDMFVHILECSETTIIQYIKELVSDTGNFKSVKIMSCQDGLLVRWFQLWFSKVLDAPSDVIAGNADEEELPVIEGDQLSQMLLEIVSNLRKLSDNLKQVSKENVKAAIKNLHNQFKNLLPKHENVKLLSSNPNLLSHEDWMYIYAADNK